jgi:S-adenosylmethionine-diacylglycerol 3-amino-3-carboxypropyl transferase
LEGHQDDPTRYRNAGMLRIRYSQCWEDPDILTEALEVTPEDDVISIASGGDNTFALLLNHPRSLTAVDLNPAQIFLMELKIRAMQVFEYDDFVSFIGATPCRDRDRLYSYIRLSLSDRARSYWDKQAGSIDKGIIHCGKFENYFSIFRQTVLPLIHTKKNIRELMGASSVEKQRIIYEEVWDNRRWQRLFRIFFGKFLLGRLGRDPSFFEYIALDDVAAELLRRTRCGLTEIPIQDNFFVEYILTGQYRNLRKAHPYLKESNFQFLKEHAGEIRLVCGGLKEHLTNLQVGAVSKLNLSDIFEYMSDGTFEMTLREALRVSREGSKLAYWTLFVPRFAPPALVEQMALCPPVSEELSSVGRTFFYGSFCLWTVVRGGSEKEN